MKETKRIAIKSFVRNKSCDKRNRIIAKKDQQFTMIKDCCIYLLAKF